MIKRRGVAGEASGVGREKKKCFSGEDEKRGLVGYGLLKHRDKTPFEKRGSVR